ncbi:MAG TPA: type IV pilus assembly protein PilM [Gaiellaceae bacterium]
MVDWNKEVKLSDLIGRKNKEADEALLDESLLPVPPPEPTPERAPEAPAALAESSPTPAPTPAAPVAVSPAPPAPPAPAQAAPAQIEPDAVEPEGERVPWYKRDLSFGGGKKAAQPKAKREKAKKEKPKKEKPKKEKPPKAERVPFYKRELSFGGKKEAKAPTGKSKQAAASAKRMKRITGLKIGGSQLAAARVNNNGVPELVQIAREDLEPGIVVGGELRDLEALSTALKDFFKRHKLPRQGVRLGIANNRIGVRIFEIGGIEDVKQLENAVRFRAHEVLPIPIEEAVIDWQVLDERQEEDGSITRRILLVVAYRDLLDRYVVACKKAGIKLVGIDLEAFALLRAISEPLPTEAGTPNAAVVVVAVGHDRSTFAVSNGRVCEFTRVLDWGGATLNVAIARELDIAPSEAEPIKRALSLTHADALEGLTEEQGNRAREAVRRQLQSFARELVSSLQFYQSQPDSLGIAEIVLTGGSVHLRGLAEELQTLVGVSVRPGDPLNRVKVGKKVREAEQIGSLAIAIGLGIED